MTTNYWGYYIHYNNLKQFYLLYYIQYQLH